MRHTIKGSKRDFVALLNSHGWELVKSPVRNKGAWNEGFDWLAVLDVTTRLTLTSTIKGERVDWAKIYEEFAPVVTSYAKSGQNTHGGARSGAGRPAVDAPARLVPLSVRVPQWIIEELTAMDGKRGDLVRDALIEHFDLKPPTVECMKLDN